MTDSRINVPHLALPLSLGIGGTLACVEQDSDDEIAQGVFVLLSTPLGRQIEIPDYGYEDQTFARAGTIDLAAAAAAVEEWQPRATIDTSVSIDTLDELVEHVRVNVTSENSDA